MKISSCVLGISLILSSSISVFAMDQVACTMEAKMCPDGSFVGRTGPVCEFTACPSATGSVIPPVACTREYVPVCAQPPIPSCGEGMTCIQVMPAPRTYANSCTARADGATIIAQRACPSGTGSVTPPIVGGDVDPYGCKPSTGYTWNSSRKMCCRSWEVNECVAPQQSVPTLSTRQRAVLDRKARMYVQLSKRRGDADIDSPFLRGVISRLDARPTQQNQYLKELLTELLTR